MGTTNATNQMQCRDRNLAVLSNGRFSRRGQDGRRSQRRGSVNYSTVKYNDTIWLCKNVSHCAIICLKQNGKINCYHRVSPTILTESCQKLNSVRQCWCDWPGCCFPACRTWLRLTYYNCRRTSPWRHIDKLHITMVQRYFVLSLGFLTDCRKSGLEQTSLQSQVVTQMHCVGISLVTNK